MSPQQLVGLSSRLFAVWLAVISLQSVAIGQAIRDGGAAGAQYAAFFFAVMYLAAALFLWFCPMLIGHKLVPRTKHSDPLVLQGTIAIEVACVVLGLFVALLRALPGVTAYASVLAFWVAGGQPVSTLDLGRHLEGVASLAQLVVGLLFVFRARTIAARILPRH
jgi:hypothetical protein